MKNSLENTLNDYLNQIGKYPLLTAEDEYRLFTVYKIGTIEEQNHAKKELIESNLRLVVNYAKRYANTSELEILDLIQDGNIGLVKAVEKFDIAKGHKFSTYAIWWIKQAIIKCLNDKSRNIRIPAYMQILRKNVYDAEKKLTKLHNRQYTDKEISEVSGVEMDKVKFIRENIKDTISLEMQVSDEGSLMEFIPDGKSIEDEINFKDLNHQLNKVLNTLTDKEKLVILHRFGLNNEIEKTLDQVSKLIGNVTRERVRQIEVSALKKLKHPSKIKFLHGFLNDN